MKQRGLTIDDETKAEECLRVISYFRLANYWRVMEADKVAHIFKPGSRFDNVLALYNFDKHLKSIIFSAIQNIEIAMRTKVIHHFSASHGAFWFAEVQHFTYQSLFSTHLESLNRELQRAKEDFITDHYTKYGKEAFPPVWKTLEVASLGILSKYFSNFSDREAKRAIAKEFQLNRPAELRSWLEAVTVLRNACAHHARVWNRSFATMPMLPGRLPQRWISNRVFPANKLYPFLCCIAYWLNAIDPQNSFVGDLKLLLLRYPTVDSAAMGFPAHWRQEPLWQI